MPDLSAGTLLQHLLFVFLLVIAPAWDYSYTRRLKRDPSSARKIGVYKTLCTWLWISSAVACAAVGLQSLFSIRLAPGEAAWLEMRWVWQVVVALIALFAVGAVLPYATVAWKKLNGQARTYASAQTLKPMMWFLPATGSERRWFAAVRVTAGVCEEVLFRGFLLHYLHVSPWHVPLTAALLIAAAIFGLQHLYQGAIGSVMSGIIGLLLSLLFLLSGTLLLPMILHALLDLRMLVILPAPTAATE